MGNMPCYYTLRSCGLHHGHHINSGHYTALIFNENTVPEINDERAYDGNHTQAQLYTWPL